MSVKDEEEPTAFQQSISDDHYPSPSEGSEDSHAGETRQQPGARPPEPEPVAASEADRRWTENWRVREIRYLSSRVEDLERQLRRKTMSLVSALVVVGLLAATAAALAVAPLQGPEPPPATGRTAGERIAELEVAGARYEATITALRTELAGARAEVRAQSTLLERSRRGVEEFNALLAVMLAGGGGHGTAGEGLQAGLHEAGGAASAPTPPKATVHRSIGDRGEAPHQATAPAEAAIRVSRTGAPSYAATAPGKPW